MATETKTENTSAKKTEKMVKIKLPRVRNGEQDDVFVSVNDRRWLIKRGEEVEVPECVAEVLKNQEAALDEAIMNDEKRKKANK